MLPKLAQNLAEHSVVVHACEKSAPLIPGSIAATEDDWGTEYLALELSVKVVPGIEDALEHISRYSTKHTESILTESIENAERFLHQGSGRHTPCKLQQAGQIVEATDRCHRR